MSAAHTEGRLVAVIEEMWAPELRSGDLVVVAVPHRMEKNGCSERDEANARRLAACWNASINLSTEALENYGRVVGMGYVPQIDHLHEIHNHFVVSETERTSRLERDLAAARALQAQLVEALRPFAEAGDSLTNLLGASGMHGACSVELSAEDLVAARAALTAAGAA